MAWFGSRQGELQTVQDLQGAIGEYAVLSGNLRAALEADRTSPPDDPISPAAADPLRRAGSGRSSNAAEPAMSDPSIGRALLELALLLGILVVVFVLALIAAIGGAANL